MTSLIPPRSQGALSHQRSTPGSPARAWRRGPCLSAPAPLLGVGWALCGTRETTTRSTPPCNIATQVNIHNELLPIDQYCVMRIWYCRKADWVCCCCLTQAIPSAGVEISWANGVEVSVLMRSAPVDTHRTFSSVLGRTKMAMGWSCAACSLRIALADTSKIQCLPCCSRRKREWERKSEIERERDSKGSHNIYLDLGHPDHFIINWIISTP